MLKKILSRFEEFLGAFLLMVMACVAFINVIVRYCTSLSFSSSEELTVNFFVWVVLLGTSRCFREGTHFSMNLLYNALPKMARLCLYLLSIVLTVGFLAALCYLGGVEVADEIALNVASESLDIPVWLYTICTPLISAVCIVRIFQRLACDIRQGSY